MNGATTTLNLAAVQDYVRADPGIAVDYLAALFKNNVESRSLDWRASAELLTERMGRDNRLFHANLDGTRMPLVGHVLTCSDPLLNSLLRDSENYLFVSRRPGAWPGLSNAVRSSFAAEMDLSGTMGAPVMIALKHKDQVLAEQQNSCNCGCAAISAAATRIHASAMGQAVPVHHIQESLKIWIDEMALAVRETAIENTRRRGIPPEDQRRFTQSVTEAFVDDTIVKIKAIDATHHEQGAQLRPVIGAVVDQRTGELWVKSGESYMPYAPQQSLVEIERDLFAVAEGRTPARNRLQPESNLAGSGCG